MTTAPVGCLDEREAFEARFKHLSFARKRGAWGEEIYAAQPVQDLWEGFQAGRASLSASRQEVDAPSDLAARFVEQHDALRRALEVIAVGDSADPVRDAGDELVALGIWSGNALEQHRAMLAAAPHQAQEAQGDRHGE
jgi:hypothetical protein